MKAAQPMHIGVWNTAFLGDAILTLPLLQTLRTAYPGAAIDFWVRKGVGELFAAHPAIDAVHEFDKRGRDRGLLNAWRLGRDMGNRDYFLWINAHPSLRSALMARWSSARIRVGYDRPGFNHWAHTHLVPRRFRELEEIERLGQLLMPLDLEERGVQRQTWPHIVLPEQAMETARRIFAPFGTDPVLGLHPGSVWATKRWPEDYFAALGSLAARKGARIVVFGGPGEEALAATVADKIGATASGAVVNLAGVLSLSELAACIGLLGCYLTNDSGPMHLAWPQRVPVVAMFGPTVRQLGFFPRGETATVMELPLDCRPCGLHGPQVCPRGHHRCMRDMTPDLVWPAVRAALSASRPDAPSFSRQTGIE